KERSTPLQTTRAGQLVRRIRPARADRQELREHQRERKGGREKNIRKRVSPRGARDLTPLPGGSVLKRPRRIGRSQSQIQEGRTKNVRPQTSLRRKLGDRHTTVTGSRTGPDA